MNWENANLLFEETETRCAQARLNERMEEEQDRIENIQLKKFQDPQKNLERQAKLALLKHFGDLLKANNVNDMVNSVLTDDCEFFLFSSTGRTPAQYCLHPKDIHNLYKGMQIQERIVRETYIDLEKGTAVQLCNFRILYEGDDDPVDEIVAEVFTIKDHKISKYRAFACKMTPAHGDSDPFENTTKDRALAVVTQVNYALSGQPNFEKVAGLLHENVKYKIWSWDSQKCYILEKHNFVENLQQNMQENFVIKRIVPYEVFTEGKVAVGTYAYHLEGITGGYVNKKYVWLTTCYYVLNEDNKIIKASQQGDLHLEGEVEPQFKVYPREKLLQKIMGIFKTGPTIELFYSDVFALNSIAYVFGPETAPNIGYNKGTTIVDKMKDWANRHSNENATPKPENPLERKLVESFVDCCESSYDIVILIHMISLGLTHLEEINHNAEGTTIIVSIFKLEHGKIMKAYGFVMPIPESIPSLFTDH